MAKLSIKAGTTSYTANVFIQDSTSTTGAGKTGLAYNTASLTAYYVRPRASAAAITLATQTVTGSWSSGGFVEIDGTNMPGWYRLDIPDAALASGATSVGVHLKGATGMAPLPLEIELTAWDNQDATSGGLSRLDAAISSRSTYAGDDTAGTTTLLSRLSATRAGYLDNLSTAPLTTLGTNAPAGWINAASIAASALDGKGDWTTDADLPVNFNTLTITNGQTVGTSTYAGGDTSGTTTLLSRLSSARAGYLDNLSGGAVALASGVTVTTNNDKTGYSLTQAFPSNFASLGIAVDGKISGVVLTDTVTTYTGNTPQTGDAYARIGAAGAGLTALGDTRLANLDATVSSRFAAATWTSQWPADFTAATFASPGVFSVDALANAPAGGGGGGGATAAQIWAYATRTLSTAPPTAEAIRDEILNAVDLETYPAHSVASTLHKLDIGEVDDPVLPVPGAPLTASKTRVYLYTADFIGTAKPGVTISVDLVSPAWPARAGGYILETTYLDFTSDAEGYAEIILFKTDEITPEGTVWRFDAAALGIKGATVAITTDTYNLKDLAG